MALGNRGISNNTVASDIIDAALAAAITEEIIDDSGVPRILAGSLVETELYSYVIPADYMGDNDEILLSILFSNYNNDTNNKVNKIKFGSTTIATITTTTNPSYIINIRIKNRNNPALQVWSIEVESGGTVTLSGNMTGTTTEDTTAPVTISITATTTKETAITLTSLTRSGTDVTVTKNSHGYNSGDFILVAGANESPYNGVFEITSAATNTFHYTAGSVPSGSATGTVTSQRYSRITLESYSLEILR